MANRTRVESAEQRSHWRSAEAPRITCLELDKDGRAYGILPPRNGAVGVIGTGSCTNDCSHCANDCATVEFLAASKYRCQAAILSGVTIQAPGPPRSCARRSPGRIPRQPATSCLFCASSPMANPMAKSPWCRSPPPAAESRRFPQDSPAPCRRPTPGPPRKPHCCPA
jgi:hypothetical protein